MANDLFAEKNVTVDGPKDLFAGLKKNYSGKRTIDLIPELKDPKELGKAALESGGMMASFAQPEIGLIKAAFGNAPKISQGLMKLSAQAGYGAAASPNSPELGAGLGAFGSGLTQLAGAKNPIFNALIRALTGGSIGGGAGYMTGGLPGAAAGASTGAGIGIGLPYIKGKLGVASLNPENEIIKNLVPKEVYKRNRAANALNTPISPGEAAGRADITAQEAQLGRVGEGATERIQIGNKRLAGQKNAISNLQSTISPTRKNALSDVREAAKQSIVSKENALQKKVEPLYEISYKHKISNNHLIDLENSDATIKNAIHSARTDPAYSAELKGYDSNSIKVLDVAKRKIDADIAKAIKNEDFDRVRVLTNSKKKLVNATDSFSPDYKIARKTFEEGSKPIDALKSSKLGQVANVKDVGIKNISKMIFDPAQTDIKVLKQVRDEIRGQNPEAWDNLINNELTRLMSKGEVRGTTFYKKVLENDNVFHQLLTALDHNPKAKKNLIHMRRAWKDLTNIESPRQGHGLSATGMKQARNDVSALIDMYAQVTNSEADIKALNMIYSKDWQNRLNNIVSNKDKRIRSEKLGEFLSSTIRGTISTLTPKEE